MHYQPSLYSGFIKFENIIFIIMSTLVSTLIRKIQDVHDISEALKTAEKAKIFGLKQKAKQVFDVSMLSK